MRRNLIVFWCVVLVLLSNGVNAQDYSAHDVYLLGNLVDNELEENTQKLFEELETKKDSFTVLLNGDLIDHRIIIEENAKQLQILFAFFDRFKDLEKGQLIITSGDRDWDSSGKDGFVTIIELEKCIKKYIVDNQVDNVHWLQKNACPGPFSKVLAPHLLLINLNSQWWNHAFDKQRDSDADCKFITDDEIFEQLEDLIEENNNKNILLLGHHPIQSIGNYGGRFSFKDHFLPFPIYASFLRAYQSNVGSSLDLANDRIKNYIKKLKNSIFYRSNIIYASSHEKNHQVIQQNENFLINSGALWKTDYSGSNKNTLFNSSSAGIVKIQYGYDGHVDIVFLDCEKEQCIAKDTILLFNSACAIGLKMKDLSDNLSFIPCILDTRPQDSTENIHALVKVSAGTQYKAGFWKKLWMGKHYRDDWLTPVSVSYLNIDSTYNGLKAYEKGGGRQTLSLKFRSEDGTPYTFRSVDKDPSKKLDFNLRETIVSKVFKDQTSANHPFGALPIAKMLDHLDILHVQPSLFILPNVSSLGPFQRQYGELLGMLEELPGKANYNGEYFAGALKVLKSNRLFKKMFDHREIKVDTDEYIRARLFDILIGDPDRHEDNWKWANFEADKNTYRPIPRDRDQAFSKWDGILPFLADREWGLPYVENFSFKIKGFKSLNYQARYLDRFLTSGLDKAHFMEQAEWLKKELTDEHIREAVKLFPEKIYENSGEDITNKLIQRKNDLSKYASKFYDLLSTNVEVIGSSKADYFDIKGRKDGAVHVRIFNRRDDGEVRDMYFDRWFHPNETKVLRIYGIGDDDTYVVYGDLDHKIQINLIGGSGKNVYESKADSHKINIYDLNISKVHPIRKTFHVVDHWDENVYEYNRQSLKQDTYLPYVVLNYSRFNGVEFQLGNTWTKHRWDKNEYASKHAARAAITTVGDFSLSYRGKWKNFFGKTNVEFATQIANPEYFNSFFGLGNDSVIDRELEAQDYYLATLSRYNMKLGISRDFWKNSFFRLESGYEINANKRIENTILTNGFSDITGANQTLHVIPVNFTLHLNLLDHSTFPYRGIRSTLSANTGFVTSNTASNFTNLRASIEYYSTSYNDKPVTLGLKFVGDKGLGDVPFYYQAELGGRSDLRGYTSQRFIGKSKLAVNSELRWQFLDSRGSIPIKVGVFGFFDMGRVFSSFDNSESTIGFRTGYGVGFYMIPLTRTFTISAGVAFSREHSFYPGINFGTALR